MESDQIKRLLEKYWNSQTNLEEEELLSQLLENKKGSGEFSREIDLFEYYKQQRKQGVSVFDETRWVANLKEKRSSTELNGSFLWTSMKIAAAVIVIVVAGWLIRNEINQGIGKQELVSDTYQDPQDAFEETKRALQLLSKNINIGRNQASRIKEFSVAQEKVKNLKGDKNDEKL